MDFDQWKKMRIHYKVPHQLIQHFEFSSFELCQNVTGPGWTTDLHT